VAAFFALPESHTQLARLRAAGLQLAQEAQKQAGDVLNGKSFVISGVFMAFERDALKDLIESLGGQVKSGVTAKTTYLLAGSDAGPAKITKAQALGVPVLSEEAFQRMIQ
jgi:DNA ligase (NAD+)